MQCEDCKYACHKNCYQKVVTKCISKSNADSVSAPSLLWLARSHLAICTGEGRGADQPPHPSPLRAHHQHLAQLVLPLRNGASSRSQAGAQVLRTQLWYNRSHRLRPPGSRFLRHVDGHGEPAAKRHQEDQRLQVRSQASVERSPIQTSVHPSTSTPTASHGPRSV